ncbi:MAG: hypothetical protein P8Z37_04100 [Acidobacteriota bacterium]
MIFTSGLYSLLFLLELTVGVIFPLVLFTLPAVRKNRKALTWSALPVLAGLILHRFNVSLAALEPRTGTVYFPHLLEFAISLSIIAAGIQGYQLASRNHPVMSQKKEVEAVGANKA